MLRSFDQMKATGHFYVLFVFCFIFVQYYTQVYLTLIYSQPKSFGIYFYLLILHVILFMQLLSMIMSILVDPGMVPKDWNCQDQSQYDNQNRKRYCVTCVMFKPERTHHCSACNRCVLNMDHHCPWINNCVGFMNRKFFMNMLIYALLLVILCIINTIAYLISYQDYLFAELTSQQIASQKTLLAKNPDAFYRLQVATSSNFEFNNIIIIVFFCLISVFFIVFSKFFYFHLNLVLTNSTTIENLDLQNKQPIFAMFSYDVGKYYNWIQVFGKNPQYWFLPLNISAGKPLGDGIIWPHRAGGTL